MRSGRISSFVADEFPVRSPMFALPGATAAFPSASPHANLRDLFNTRKASEASIQGIPEAGGWQVQGAGEPMFPQPSGDEMPSYDDSALLGMLGSSQPNLLPEDYMAVKEV